MSNPTAAASPQPLRALELANRVRRARSELKGQIADGRLPAAEVILTCPSEIARMPIVELLASQQGWGEVRSRAFLAQVAVREDKAIGSLTERQRHFVASLLTRTVARAELSSNLRIRESRMNGRLRLSLTGELDLATTPALEDRLARLRARKSPVRLDLSDLDFIDSAGLHLLIRTVGDARIKRWQLRIEPDVAPQVLHLFRLVHLDRFLAAGEPRSP